MAPHFHELSFVRYQHGANHKANVSNPPMIGVMILHVRAQQQRDAHARKGHHDDRGEVFVLERESQAMTKISCTDTTNVSLLVHMMTKRIYYVPEGTNRFQVRIDVGSRRKVDALFR